MKRYIRGLIVTAILLVFPVFVAAVDYLAEADRIFDQGGIENYKKSIDLYIKAVEQQPDDYEAAWKCARAHREYADEAKKKGVEGWKDICAQYGKAGMQYAQKAIECRHILRRCQHIHRPERRLERQNPAELRKNL